MPIQLDNNADHQLHFDAIHALSERYHVDESKIREMYESKLEELSFNATITSFLPVLIERHVKNILLYTTDAYV
jgi:hypothetical protein